MNLLIKNSHIIDPANNIDEICDILVEGTKIKHIAKGIRIGAEKVIDAIGKVAIPGFVDMHVHLREPGREDKETIETATKAGLKGGVTSLLAMPNTRPPIDSLENIELLRAIIEKTANSNVFIAACITKARNGEELTDIAVFKKDGVVAITDDGSSVDNAELLLAALKKAKENNILVVCHCEDKSLSGNGVINLGIISTTMGLRGISRESEYKRVERDIGLAKRAKAPIHIAHISCKESVEIIKEAKKAGVRVTADVTPHHFTFTQEAVKNYDTNMKMKPPLRSREDLEAIKEGLRDGTIDAIASDHAPHTENEKDIEFDRAEFGVIGLETSLSAGITELVSKGVLNWKEFVSKTSTNPAKILGIEKGTLGAGADADIVIIDPEVEWVFTKEEILSKSKNSPFIGKTLKGKVIYTICSGKIAYEVRK